MVSATTPVVTQWVEGTVGMVDVDGFALAASGRTGTVVRRYRVSRYASPAPPLPREGQQVRVGLDKAGYVRVIDAVSERADHPAAAPTVPATPRPAAPPAAVAPEPPKPSEPPEPSGDDLAAALAAFDADRADPDDLPFPSGDGPPASPSAVPRVPTAADRAQRQPGPAAVSTRLACLTAAATLLGNRTPVAEAATVLAIAEQFEQWATRPDATDS